MKRPAFPTKDDLVQGWIDLHLTENLDGGHWAEFMLDDIVDDYPEEAWQVILELNEKVHGTNASSLLAAGPLENLIVRHGGQLLERIEKKAEEDKKFRDLLAGVWQQGMPEEHWGRVQRAVTGKSNQHSQRPSYGLNRTWRSTLKIQFQFGRVLFALAGRRLTGNDRRKKDEDTYPYSQTRWPLFDRSKYYRADSSTEDKRHGWHGARAAANRR